MYTFTKLRDKRILITNHNGLATNENEIIKGLSKREKLQYASSFAEITQQKVSSQCNADFGGR